MSRSPSVSRYTRANSVDSDKAPRSALFANPLAVFQHINGNGIFSKVRTSMVKNGVSEYLG